MGEISLKEWLQKTARSLRPMASLLQEAVARVTAVGGETFTHLNYNIAIYGNNPITPTCRQARTFNKDYNSPSCPTNTAFQNMMYATYITGNALYLSNFISSASCCTTMDACVPSVGETPADKKGTLHLIDVAIGWLFGSVEYGRLATQLPDAAMLKTRILHWDNPQLELFSRL